MTPVTLLPKVRSEAIMQAMQHMPCSLRVASLIPGRSCSSQATVVGAHLPVMGRGMSTKVTDLAVAAGCHACHDIVDQRDKNGADFIISKYPAAYAYRLLNGLVETQARLVEMGIITVKDGEII